MRRFLPAALLCASLAFPQTADLVLRNGKVVTMETAQPEARAVAIRGGRILAIGTEQEVRRSIGSATRVIDLKGRLAIPGFIEGHGHFTGVGNFRLSLNLREAKRWADIVDQVARAARTAQPGAWIYGRGWHQSKWDQAPQPNIEGFPLHAALSAVSPRNPVLLVHASGHAAFANAAALRAAGITRETPDPPGGRILKDAHGNPSGLLQERAQQLASKAFDDWQAQRSRADREAEALRVIDLAQDECLAKGITSFQDAGSPFETVDRLRTLDAAGKLRLRLWLMLRAPTGELARNLARYRIASDYLTVRAIKRSIDGALGSRGAWLLEPYTDLPASRGINTEDVADIRRTAEIAIDNGFQLCVHAIGDRANRETLDIFEQAFRVHPEKKDLRWRIEHAQHISAADIPRFGQLGVIAAMQGIHCTSDAPYVLERLGARRAEEGAYVWQKLLQSGAVVGNGTDAPVEDVSPIASFYATVSRKLKDGSVFYSAQRLSREQALRSYTVSNAYAAFEEQQKGSLKAGKFADITVLSRDIMTIAEDDIPSTDVVYTIVGGTVAYRNRLLAPE